MNVCIYKKNEIQGNKSFNQNKQSFFKENVCKHAWQSIVNAVPEILWAIYLGFVGRLILCVCVCVLYIYIYICTHTQDVKNRKKVFCRKHPLKKCKVVGNHGI